MEQEGAKRCGVHEDVEGMLQGVQVRLECKHKISVYQVMMTWHTATINQSPKMVNGNVLQGVSNPNVARCEVATGRPRGRKVQKRPLGDAESNRRGRRAAQSQL